MRGDGYIKTIVSRDLRAGFGAEDIAVRRCLPVHRVRMAINTMRDFGALARIYSRSRAA